MVVVSDMPSVFWGVTLIGGKKYSQTVERTFRVSMAALDHTEESKSSDKPVSVMIEHNKSNFVLCTLQHGKVFQQTLDLTFVEDEEVTFFLHGQGTVHLTGYAMEDEPEFDPNRLNSEEDEEEDISEADMSDDDSDAEVKSSGKKMKLPRKRKATMNESTTCDDEDDDDDSEDEDFDASNLIDDEAEESDGLEELRDDDDDNDDSEEDTTPIKKHKDKSLSSSKKKKIKLDDSVTSTDSPVKSNGKKKQNKSAVVSSDTSVTHDTSVTQSEKSFLGNDGEKKKKKKKKKNKNQPEAAASTANTEKSSAQSPSNTASTVPKKRTLEGGVVVEDTKEGHGPVAKVGKKINVYYTGRLVNGKLFDSQTSGKGFQFKLGKKEVISGWDLGLAGMKVGGKRTITVPPKMGYGGQKAGTIPPNSTLVFDVELRAVN